MAHSRVQVTLIIHACPSTLTHQFSDVFEANLWVPQTLLEGSMKAEKSMLLTTLQATDLVSRLGATNQIHADVIFTGKGYGTINMIAPGLGIFRAETNPAGEIVISEERIRQAVEISQGNYRELTRLLRLYLGQAWDDVLEPFRAAKYSDNISLITKAG